MGLTIHYKLQANTGSAKQARQLLEQLRQKALDLPFKEIGEIIELDGDSADFNKLDKEDENRWLLIQAGQYIERDQRHFKVTPQRLIAFPTWPGEGTEQANFGLATYPKTIEAEGKKIRTDLGDWSWGSVFARRNTQAIPNVAAWKTSCGAIWPS